MTLVELTPDDLLASCGSRRWVELMLARAPFAGADALHEAADECFEELEEQDWLEAFAHHPRIGDLDALRERFAASGAFSEREQEAVEGAHEAVLRELQRGNEEYERAFGLVFLVRAAGRSADEILQLQRARLGNDRGTEIATAAGEQRQITHLRLDAQIGRED